MLSASAGADLVRALFALTRIEQRELELLQGFDGDDYNGRPVLVAPLRQTSAAPEPERRHSADDSGTPPPGVMQPEAPTAFTTSGAAESLPFVVDDNDYRPLECAGCGRSTLALLCTRCTEAA